MNVLHSAVTCTLAFCAITNGVKASPPTDRLDASSLAREIDKHIDTRIAADSATAAGDANDAEFMRRVYLDLAGKIPSVSEVRRFLDDKSADKRQRFIEALLESPRYSVHFANVWRAAMLPDTAAGAQNPNVRGAFEARLGQQLKNQTSYDQMVRAILAPSGAREFYVANEDKPENLAAATSRIFLGVKIECAQCHRHPFAPWSREQFWSMAAFFPTQQARKRNRRSVAAPPREIKILGTDKTVRAKFLDDTEPSAADGTDPRMLLAQWVTAADNPWFARAAVNRIWAHFFGIGLVDPVDELGEQNPPSHPELLDELTNQFVATNFDLKYLIRAITNSRAYQRTSLLTHPSKEDARLFARMALKGLTSEQLFDSLAQATGYRDESSRRGTPAVRTEFMTKFGGPSGQRTEFQLSILQALSLMNGKLTASATDLEHSETLAAVVDAPFLDNSGRIETLYLASLGRLPHPEEMARLQKYIDAEPAETRKRAFADVFWALLNSGEFILNH